MRIHVAILDPGTTFAALEYGFDVAAVTGGDVTLVYVVSPPPERPSRRPDSTASRSASDVTAEADAPVRSEEEHSIVQTDRSVVRAHDETEADATIRMTERDRAAVAAGRRVLERGVDHAEAAGHPIETKLLRGDPFRAVVSFAEDRDTGLLAVEKPRTEPTRIDDPARRAVRELGDHAPLPTVIVPA